MIASRTAALLLSALVLAGCFDDAAPTAAPTATRAPAPTPVTTTYPLGATIWYAGLIVTLGRAVAVLDERGGSVTVEARIENPGEALATVAGPVRLEVDGEWFAPTRETQIPEVEPGTGAEVTIEFDVIGHRSADAAAIVIGRDGEHQPRVPFGPGGGELAAFEPLSLQLTGNGTAGSLRLRLRGAELRWDLPDWGQQLPSSKASLTVVYDGSYVGSFAGGFPFTGENVALRLPDGTLVEPRQDGRSQSIELIGAGKTKRELRSRFEIPAGLSGSFALVVIDGGSRRAIVFAVPE